MRETSGQAREAFDRMTGDRELEVHQTSGIITDEEFKKHETKYEDQKDLDAEIEALEAVSKEK